MKNQGYTKGILSFLHRVLLIDDILAGIVGLISLTLGMRTFEAYGTLLGWAGVGVILIAGLTAVGGFSSRGEDAEAFSLTGAGNISEHIKRISEGSQSSLGCFILLLVAGLGLVILSYFLPFITLLGK